MSKTKSKGLCLLSGLLPNEARSLGDREAFLVSLAASVG